MGRRVVAGMLALAVPAAALCALFVHAHPDDHDTDHHLGRSIHAHMAGHVPPSRHVPVNGPIVDHDNDDHDRALLLEMFVAEGPAAFAIGAAVPEAIDLPVPAERPAGLTLHVVHGHDPPFRALLPARAPPAFLS